MRGLNEVIAAASGSIRQRSRERGQLALRYGVSVQDAELRSAFTISTPDKSTQASRSGIQADVERNNGIRSFVLRCGYQILRKCTTGEDTLCIMVRCAQDWLQWLL